MNENQKVLHELEIARQTGGDPRSVNFQEIAAQISSLRAALDGAK